VTHGQPDRQTDRIAISINFARQLFNSSEAVCVISAVERNATENITVRSAALVLFCSRSHDTQFKQVTAQYKTAGKQISVAVISV